MCLGGGGGGGGDEFLTGCSLYNYSRNQDYIVCEVLPDQRVFVIDIPAHVVEEIT